MREGATVHTLSVTGALPLKVDGFQMVCRFRGRASRKLQGGDGPECGPVARQTRFDVIHTRGGDSIAGLLVGPHIAFFAEVPERKAEFFARKAAQTFQIEEGKTGKLVVRRAFAVKQAEDRQTAIPLAFKTVEEIAGPEIETRDGF